LTCRSVGGTLTGAVEAANLLYSDDLIEDREESLNPLRLENKYQAYLNQLLDRKKDGCKELMVGTRWNVSDPLGRIEAQYKDNPRYRFRKIPALNEYGESNFVYEYGLGFSTQYYIDIQDKLDKNEWMAKYQLAPFVREGLLFPSDELNYYNGTLPGVEPDRILFAGDVAWGGGDSLSQPFCYQFGEDGYIHDVVFNRGDKTVTRPIVVGKIIQHKAQMGRYEANNGGDEYADNVNEDLLALGYHCNISHRKAPSNQAKMSRIIQYAPEIKKFYYIDDKHASPEYRKFMAELTTTVQTGANEHDDAADSMAQLVAFMENGGGFVKIFKRPC
jgi:predicted phage terminase large subunit-like protein